MKFFSGIKISIFIFIALAAIVFFLPKTTSAQWAVAEVNPLMNAIEPAQTILNTATNIKSWVQTSFEWAYKMALEILRRQLLNMIVDQIVNWVQGGGTPKFVSDWPGFLSDAADQAGGKFLQQIGLGRFCSAFKMQLSMGFIPIPKFSDRSACTISQVGTNLENFLNDFQSGGWVAWEQMVLRPENNIYGAYLMAWDQMEIEKAAAVKAAEAEAQAGKGFLSVKKCVAWDGPALQACMDIEGNSFEDCKKASCTKEQVTTPGAVIGDVVSQAVGSDIPYIISAQELSAYVSAIANAILNRMFSEGLGALRTAISGGGGGSSGGSSGGGTGGSASSQCASLLGKPGYNECVSSIQAGQDIRAFQKTTLIDLISQDTAYQTQLLGAKQATLSVLGQTISILSELSRCQGITTDQPDLAKIQSAKTGIERDISKIQSDIIALQLKQQEINAITDITQVPAVYNQVIELVNPARTQSLNYSAQQETITNQQNMSYYQQQLTQCQNPPGGNDN